MVNHGKLRRYTFDRADGGLLAYHIVGDERRPRHTLVYFHGADGRGRDVCAYHAPALKKGVRAIGIHRPADCSDPTVFARHLADLLVRELRVDKCILLGYNAGCEYAIVAAGVFPEGLTVQALVLVVSSSREEGYHRDLLAKCAAISNHNENQSTTTKDRDPAPMPHSVGVAGAEDASESVKPQRQREASQLRLQSLTPAESRVASPIIIFDNHTEPSACQEADHLVDPTASRETGLDITLHRLAPTATHMEHHYGDYILQRVIPNLPWR